MKNNKKIYLLTALALFTYGQEMFAMGAARKAAQRLWDYKFALVGTGLTAACGFEFHNARSKQEALIKAGKITTAGPSEFERTLAIFESDKREIRDRFREAGFTVQFADMGGRDFQPNMGAGSVGDQAFLVMNTQAMLAFLRGHTEFSREEMQLILDHELVHAFDRHVEKGLAVESFLPAFNFSVAVGVYKGVSACLGKFGGLRKPIGQLAAVATALGVASAIKMNEQYIKLAHRRSCEWKADGVILNSGDSEKIKTYRGFYQKMKRYDEDQKRCDPRYFTDCDLPFYLRTNPTHDERIEACNKALAELKAAKK